MAFRTSSPTSAMARPAARWRVLAAAWMAAGVAASAAGAWAQPAARHAPLPPIRVGAVSSLTGPAPFPESTEAARAYFEVINAAGGVQGCRLQLVVMDDRGDPAVAKAAARALAAQPDIVAHVGSSSIVDCTANAAHYRAQGLVSVQGTGVEPACFSSSHIVPVNTGPYLSLRNALQYATDVLQARRPCAFVLDLPGMRPGYDAVLAQRGATATPLALVRHFRSDEDPRSLVAMAAQARCDAIVHTGIEPMVVAWVQAGRARPELRGVPQVFFTPAYTAKVAATLVGGPGERIYSMAEFEPWSSRTGALSDWKFVMGQARVPLSSFSQGGYTAAQMFVRVLRSIRGDITRDSVGAAFRRVGQWDMPMAGTPFTFGEREAHNPNRATLPMRLTDGTWRIAHPAWIVAPP